MRSIAEIFRSHAVFDTDGRHVNGTDKESNHRYGDAYERLFPNRESVKLMMEVGVTDGSCMLAWHEVFPNATVVGMDIEPSAGARIIVLPLRMEFHYGDQRVRADCERAAKGRQFDFIIEDATHELANTLLTLYYLWPFIKPGGIYVVEEWENADADRHRIPALWPNAEIIDTIGPFGGMEPLVVFRKLPI